MTVTRQRTDTTTVSTDDFAGWLALQTNLALKGIIGINAMSKLAEVAGYHTDVTYYKVGHRFSALEPGLS